jgi:nucleoside-diphosphate-sugar epimerase
MKYGYIKRPHDNHPNFKFYNCDVMSQEFQEIFQKEKPEMAILAACLVGGIPYFNTYQFAILSDNNKIMSSCFEAAIRGKKEGWFKRVIAMSSSMVYENCFTYPSKEEYALESKPPSSTYGFSKLTAEYYCFGAKQQHDLDFSIIRPFNIIGLGEEDTLGEKEIESGGIKLTLSHVTIDLITKVLKGQTPLHIYGDGSQRRHFTAGIDIGSAIVKVVESDAAINETFNISTPIGHSVLELAEKIWTKIHPDKKFEYITEKPFNWDVQKREPCTEKAERILDFKAETPIDIPLDECIEYFKNKFSIKEHV